MPNGSRHKFDLCLFDLKFHVCLFVCLFVYLASTHMSRDEDNKTILRKLLPFYSCSFLPFCTFAHLLSLSLSVLLNGQIPASLSEYFGLFKMSQFKLIKV